jgi:tripartite-type tricarboxylate transporter receptor subunit TctC
MLIMGSALLCCVGVLSVPITASATTTPKSAHNCTSANGIKIKDNALVCKGLQFYKGQTIDLISPGSVGGQSDVQEEAMIPSLEAYLGVNIVETRITTGASVPGMDAIASASANGLTMGLLNPIAAATDVLEQAPGINFNPFREAYLSGSGPSPMDFLTLPNSGVTTFAQFLTEAKAGTARITYLSGLVGTIFRALMGALGGITNANSSQWVSGYSNQAAEVTGLLRGDAPFGMLSLVDTCSLIQGGQVVPLMGNVVPVVGTDCRKNMAPLPTFADLAKTYGKTKAEKKLFATVAALDNASGYPMVTQTKVANYKVQALRAAFLYVYHTPSYISATQADGISSAYMSPVTSKYDYNAVLTDGKSVICYVDSSVACS